MSLSNGTGIFSSGNVSSGTGGGGGGGTGTVTSVSVVSANGLTGSVANPTTTPAITLTTSINAPVLAGNGTAISAATTTGSGSTAVLATSPTIATPTLSGVITLPGSTSGTLSLAAPAIAGTTAFTLPANNGTAGYLLSTDGSGNTSWIADPSPTNNTIVSATLTGTYTINPANGNYFLLTMSASTSIGITAPPASPAWQKIEVQIVGATGSENDVLGWDNSITWSGGIPNINRAAGAVTNIELEGQNGTWYGSVKNSGTQIINDQTGSSSYIFTSSDHNAVVLANYASNIPYTLPQQSTSSLEPGYTTKLINSGNGNVRIVKTGSDVILTGNTLVATDATLTITLTSVVAGVNYWSLQGGTSVQAGNLEKTFSNAVANSYAYPLLLESESNGTITGITICASSAAVAGTFIVAINGTAVTGLNAVATGTTTPLNYTATANNTYQVGDIITITFSGSTTLLDVTASLKITTYQNVQYWQILLVHKPRGGTFQQI